MMQLRERQSGGDDPCRSVYINHEKQDWNLCSKYAILKNNLYKHERSLKEYGANAKE